MFDAISSGKSDSVDFFNKWTEEVKRTVPKDRLLVFEVCIYKYGLKLHVLHFVYQRPILYVSELLHQS